MSIEWLVRLRADGAGITDLAGNSWIGNYTLGGSAFSNTASKSIHVNGQKLYFTPTKQIASTDDFTIAFWVYLPSVPSAAHPIFGRNDTDANSLETDFFTFTYYYQNNIGVSIWLVGNFGTPAQAIAPILLPYAGNPSPAGAWHHIAYTRKSGILRSFYDGTLVSTIENMTNSVLGNKEIYIGYSPRWNNYTEVYVDDVCIIKGTAIWDNSFSVPTNYLRVYSKVYLDTNNIVYTIQNNTFQKVANDWTALTDAEKIALFKAEDDADPAISDLSALGKFRIVSYSDTADQPVCQLTAVPTDQVVTPKKLISLHNYEKIDSVSITNTTSGNAAIKVAVTTDLATYQVYDTASSKWVAIDISTPTLMAANAMNASTIASIPASAWALLGTEGIGFAYLLSMSAINESCNADALVLTVDMKGSWNHAVYGTDVTYGYPNNDLLQIDLLTNGDFKIDYNAGEVAKG